MPTKKKKLKKIVVTKKNAGLVIFLLKFFRIFNIVLTCSIVIIIVALFIMFYKINIIDKTLKNVPILYSKYFNEDIRNNIEISGVDNADIFTINNKINNFCNLENKNNLNILLNDIKQDPWIKDISIRRILPNTIKININEYLPFAILKNSSGYHLIDERGNIINVSERERRGYYNLLFISGGGAKYNIHSLFNVLSTKPLLFSRIKSLIRVGSRRWDLELDNGILVKMPEDNNIVDAWNNLEKILKIKGSEVNIKVIDLRNNDKIFLEENEN